MTPDPAAATTVGPWLRQLDAEHGDREAVVRGRWRLTYRELNDRSSSLAAALIATGVSKGDRVGIMLPNGPAWVIAFASVTRIGAVAVPISTLATARELEWLLRNASITTLIAIDSHRGHNYLDRLEQALPGLGTADGTAPLELICAPLLQTIHTVGSSRQWAAPLVSDALDDTARDTPVSDSDRDRLESVEASVDPHDPLVVIHTSGSTSDPKGVIHSQGAFLTHTHHMAHDYAAVRVGDTFCSPRPWFWVAGLAADLTYSLQVGATFVVPDSLEPEPMARLVRDERIDFIGGSLPWFLRLADSAAFADLGLTCVPIGIDVAGVARVASSRSSPTTLTFVSSRFEVLLPANRAATFDARRFPNLFGMTETIGTHSGLPHGTLLPEGREGSSGPPVPGMERRVLDTETGAPVDPGSSGELLVRGATLMLGLDRQGRTETFDADDWYRTGDLCRLDHDGWITYRGRLDDTVKISGANVAPLEVERVLDSHPDVLEAHVMGVQGPDGPILTAAIVLRSESIDRPALDTWMRERLSAYKVPRSIVELGAADIPRTASGKVRKAVLSEAITSAPADPLRSRACTQQ